MILTGTDIRNLVNECVTRIMEARGALNNCLSGLADLIISRFKAGEEAFTLTKEEIAQYYPYKHVPDFLNVKIQDFMSSNIKGSYGPVTNTLRISKSLVFFMLDYHYNKEYEPQAKTVLMHELTHFVNHFESQENTDTMARPLKMDRTDKSKIAKDILYFFDKKEINARVTEFKWDLKRNSIQKPDGSISKLSDYDNTTHLKYMYKLIKLVEDDAQPGDDKPLSVVELLLLSRGNRKRQIDGRERMLNPTPEDFENAKKAIVKKLTRAYNEFYQKLAKIYYDEVSSLG